MTKKLYKRKIIYCETDKGILYIPKELKSELPFSEEQKIEVNFEGNIDSFNYNFNRLVGLKSFYQNTGISNGDLLSLKVLNETLHIFREEEEALLTEELLEEANCVESVSLSNTVKGNIAEDRIKEYILFHGQELLNVYKPVIDRNGVDFIVMQNGFYHPIYLQIKSRYYSIFQNLDTEIYLSEKTFTSNVNFYIVCVYFNEKSLEMLEDILFIPSEIVEKKAAKKEGKIKLSVSFSKDSKNEWNKYLVNKSQLVDKILEEISLMSKYYR